MHVMPAHPWPIDASEAARRARIVRVCAPRAWRSIGTCMHTVRAIVSIMQLIGGSQCAPCMAAARHARACASPPCMVSSSTRRRAHGRAMARARANSNRLGLTRHAAHGRPAPATAGMHAASGAPRHAQVSRPTAAGRFKRRWWRHCGAASGRHWRPARGTGWSNDAWRAARHD